jgi:hypothetical protein
LPTIGLDCEIILDGTGYFIEPASFHLARPRVRRADLTRTAASGGAGVGERYVDQGRAKREWSFTVLAHQAMKDFAGNAVGSTGQTYRDALHTSYQKVATTISFTDPHGTSWTVRFDDLAEDLVNVRAVGDGELQYLCHVTLVEA